jgi:hypothetical protein
MAILRRLSLLAILAIVTFTLATPAVAAPVRAGHHDPACVADCREAAEDCREDALAKAKLCATVDCADEKQAARTACHANRDSDACHDAQAAAQACIQDCRADFQDALAACHKALRACVAACPLKPAP